MTDNTIEIESSRTEKRVMRITLPYFVMTSFRAYKILSADKCVYVQFSKHLDPVIEVAFAGLAFNQPDATQCTEAEFLEKYREVESRLSEIAKTTT